jgi:phage baseplate assembly protein W
MALEIYSDIPLDNTEIYPYKVLNEEAVKQAITMILTAFDGLRLFRPELDVSLEDLLFNPMDVITEQAVTNEVIIKLEEFDSRISVEEVVFDRDERNETLNVVVYYSIKGLDTNTREAVIQAI